MPKILPVSDEVYWPINEGTIGVVGVAPYATLEFMKTLYNLTPASKDWHYPRLLVDMNTKIPSRGRYLELNETSPAPAIYETIKELARNGADVALVPCNTAHLFFNDWGVNTPIPVINIVDSVMSELIKCSPKKIAVFGSQSTENKGLYSTPFIERGGEVHKLDKQAQQIVSQAIAEVKLHGRVSEACLTNINNTLIVLKSAGVDSVILACTELSSLSDLCKNHALIVIDSNKCLAKSALNFVGLDSTC